MAFDIAGQAAASTKPVAADATEGELANGICVTYTSDLPIRIDIGLGETGDALVAYDNPQVTLPKSTSPRTKTFHWSDFEQAGWGVSKGGAKITGEEAAAQIVTLKFTVQGNNGIYNFNIMSLGSYDYCD